jgi:glycosyltransferase involved in cell wall biosynthesis
VGSARYPDPLDETTLKKWRALAGLGLPMVVIGFSSSLRPRAFVREARFLLLPLLPLPALRYLVALACVPALALWVILRYNARVLIAQSPPEGGLAALAKIAARLMGRRVALIVESHGDFERDIFLYRRVGLASLVRWLIGATSRFAFRHADGLRAISGSTRRQLERYAPGRPIEQFMAWTDSQAFLETKRSDPPSRSHTLLYAGVMIPRKGLHVLIDAFAAIAPNHPEARLALVGDEQNREYAAQLRQQIEACGLSDWVEMVGQVSQAELAQRFAGARAVILPSLSEGLGRVVVEAMLCGVPVIASRVGGIPDVVQEGVTGFLVPPGDAPALAEALSRALTGQEVDGMGRAARDFARAFFSPQAFVEGHRRLIAAALRQAGISG